MGSPMYASVPTGDGQWYAIRICSKGWIAYVIPGLFATKIASDENAKRALGCIS